MANAGTLRTRMEKIAYGSDEDARFMHTPSTSHVYVMERVAKQLMKRWIFMKDLSDLLREALERPRTQPGNHLEAAFLFGRLFSCAVRVANGVPVLQGVRKEVEAEKQMAAVVKDAREGGKDYVAALVSLFSSNLLRDANASGRARGAPQSFDVAWSIEDEFFHFSRGVEAFFSKHVVFKTHTYVRNKHCDVLSFTLKGTFFEDLVRTKTTLQDDEMAFELIEAKAVKGNGIVIFRRKDEAIRLEVQRVLERYVKKHAFAIAKALPRDAVDSTAPPRASPPIDARSDAPPPAKKMRTKNLPDASGALDADQLRVRYEYERVMLERTIQAHALGRDSAESLGLFYSDLAGSISKAEAGVDGFGKFYRSALDMLHEVSKMDDNAAVEHAGLRTSVYARSFSHMDAKDICAKLSPVLIDTRVQTLEPRDDNVVDRLRTVQSLEAGTKAYLEGYHMIAPSQLNVLKALSTFLTGAYISERYGASRISERAKFREIGRGKKNVALGYAEEPAAFRDASVFAQYVSPFGAGRKGQGDDVGNRLRNTVLRLPRWIETGHTLEEGVDMVMQYLLASRTQCGPHVFGAVIFHISALVDVSLWDEAKRRDSKIEFSASELIRSTRNNANQFGVLLFVEKMPLTIDKILRGFDAPSSVGEVDESVKVSKALWNLIGRMSKAGIVLFDFHGDNVMFHPNNLDSSGRPTGYEARLIDFDALFGTALTCSDFAGTAECTKSNPWEALYVLNGLVLLTLFQVDIGRSSLLSALFSVKHNRCSTTAVQALRLQAEDLMGRIKTYLASEHGSYESLSLPARLLLAPWAGGFKGSGVDVWSFEDADCSQRLRLESVVALGDSLHANDSPRNVAIDRRLLFGLRLTLYHSLARSPIDWVEEVWKVRQGAVEKFVPPSGKWNPNARLAETRFLEFFTKNMRDGVAANGLKSNLSLTSSAWKLLTVRRHATRNRGAEFTVADLMTRLLVSEPLESPFRDPNFLQPIPTNDGFYVRGSNAEKDYTNAIQSFICNLRAHDDPTDPAIMRTRVPSHMPTCLSE